MIRNSNALRSPFSLLVVPLRCVLKIEFHQQYVLDDADCRARHIIADSATCTIEELWPGALEPWTQTSYSFGSPFQSVVHQVISPWFQSIHRRFIWVDEQKNRSHTSSRLHSVRSCSCQSSSACAVCSVPAIPKRFRCYVRCYYFNKHRYVASRRITQRYRYRARRML